MIKSTLLFLSFIIFCAGCKKKSDFKDTLKSGLVAYYPFNNNTNDESGNANNGVALKNEFSADAAGHPNQAFNFDGSNYIKVSNSSSLSSIKDAISITAWVNNAGQGVSVVCKAGYNGSVMQFRLYSDQVIMFANNGNSSDFMTTLNPQNTWKHIAIVSDGNSSKYYLNGALQSTIAPHDDEVSNDTSTEMYIGADTHGITEYYNGKLDEIRIYNRTLTDKEVMEIYKR